MDDERRLSDVEAMMRVLEADPHLSSAFANVTLFDRPPDPDRLRERMVAALRVVPRLRRRVVDPLGGLAPPRWEDDPGLDLDHHVRHEVLDGPGDLDQLLARATEIASGPFADDRPLWEFVIVDGLADGRGAMVQKLHHTITDGEGGVRMSAQFVDFERDPPAVPAPDPVDSVEPASTGPSSVEAALDALSDWTRTPRDLLRQVVDGAGDLIADPSRVGSLPADVADTARSLARQLGVTGQCLSPLWRDRTLDRRLLLHRVPLAEVKDAATALGGSVNDLFVAAAAGGAGGYHRHLGVEVDELRMAMPVSTRTDRSSGGNSFAPTRVRVPVGADPRRRFAEVHERLSTTKEERAVGLMGSIAGAATLVPAPLLVRLVRQQTAAVDFTTSNVRGAPFPLFIAGAEILSNHPIGPLAGTAWNLTTMSVNGSLDMGLHVDTGSVADPVLLRDEIRSSLDELLALG